MLVAFEQLINNYDIRFDIKIVSISTFYDNMGIKKKVILPS
jgi:hypothetical protein